MNRLVRGRVDRHNCRVRAAGIVFKENVLAVRTAGIVAIVERLSGYDVTVDVRDPVCDADTVRSAHGVSTGDPDDPSKYSAVILAVRHTAVVDMVAAWIRERRPLVLIGIRGAIVTETVPADVSYWRL